MTQELDLIDRKIIAALMAGRNIAGGPGCRPGGPVADSLLEADSEA